LAITERKSEKTRAVACSCSAFDFPHRPGSGACTWPHESPAVVESTTAVTAETTVKTTVVIESDAEVARARAARRERLLRFVRQPASEVI
jgi:hypothetical protein